ncbi:MAG: response regulator [Thermodesulfobacteriota bacterium]|nr:response regulator [Thermodesulfobacteriota bacterium]
METIDTAMNSEQGHQMPPPHILLMEDERSIANGLKMVLTEEGYQVDLAMTGQGALDSFFGNGFDLLVADLRLPDIDGFEVIKQVKAKRPETEVVVITGYSSVYSAVDAMKLGVYDYLPKPFTEDEIKTAVSKALENKKKAGKAEQVAAAESQEEKLIQKREVIKVLNRTAEDEAFWTELMENGSEALEEYHLSDEAKAAIISGDLKWINDRVGELTQKQLMFIFKRLEREVW